MILFIAGYGRFCFRFDPMRERDRERENQEREVRRDGWRGWCRSRRKTLAKLNSPEPRVSLNSIPEMEVIIITSSSGWRLRQLWLMSWSLFDVLLFLRDAPAESNAVSTIPNQTADADTCSLAWAETATTPKQRKLAARKKQISLEAETVWVHCLPWACLCLCWA